MIIQRSSQETPQKELLRNRKLMVHYFKENREKIWSVYALLLSAEEAWLSSD